MEGWKEKIELSIPTSENTQVKTKDNKETKLKTKVCFSKEKPKSKENKYQK